jgi:hypothetical protein
LSVNLNRSILILVVGFLGASVLAACGASSTTATKPNAAATATSTASAASTQSPTVPASTAGGQAQAVTALANGVAARFGPVGRQCQSTSHSQADFVSCLKAHGVQISGPSGGQAKLDACLKRAHDATALGQCAKLVGAP